MKFRTKPQLVEAIQFIKGVNTPPGVRYNPKASPEAAFKNKYGDFLIESGDWVITDSHNNVFKMSDEQFKQTYEPVEG